MKKELDKKYYMGVGKYYVMFGIFWCLPIWIIHKNDLYVIFSTTSTVLLVLILILYGKKKYNDTFINTFMEKKGIALTEVIKDGGFAKEKFYVKNGKIKTKFQIQGQVINYLIELLS